MSNDSFVTAGQLRVLVVSPSMDVRRLVHEALAGESLLELHVHDFHNHNGDHQAARDPIDLVVVDGACADVKHWSERWPEAAVVALTGSPDAQARDSLVASGATDSFSLAEYNGHPDFLLASLRQTIRYHAIRVQHHRLQQALAERTREVRRLACRLAGSSPYDFRTGWFSHSHIVDRCQEEICRAARYHQPLALVLLELLGLRRIEGDRGLDFADEMVTQISARIRLISRQSDVAGHYGDDSFLLLLPGTDESGAERFCQRLDSTLATPFDVRGIAARLSWRRAYVFRSGQSDLSPTDLLNQLEHHIEAAKPSLVADFAECHP